jgi:hypothetical protein
MQKEYPYDTNGLRRAQNTVITEYIKPTQGRLSKQGNNKQSQDKGKEGEELFLG